MPSNSTYVDIKRSFQSLAGIATFDQIDDFFFLNGLNRASYKAYNACLTWPRYLVAAQARPVLDSLITSEYDNAADIRTASASISSNVITLTMVGASVLFSDGMQVVVSGLGGTTTSSPNGTFSVLNAIRGATAGTSSFTYKILNPYVSNTTTIGTVTGTATITPVAIPQIASFNRIWSTQPLNLLGARELDFYTQSNGVTLINNTSDLNSAWVGFKKIWDGPYTDTSTTIPSEFYDYIVYSCLADFYRSDGQTDKAIDADRMMKNVLDQEMSSPESQRNLNVVLKGMSNHISKQSRY